jgi:glycosyltransferase involved in cell wall biosynthesis
LVGKPTYFNMLSILIPVYNFDVTELVESLNLQAEQAGADFELIVIDDASDENYKIRNKTISNIKNVKYFEEKENIGRTRIRNKLADLSSYRYLLFIDCDSKVQNNDYILKYLEYCNNDIVVCGGRTYMPGKPENSKYYLRWIHGIRREQFSPGVRKREPNKSFMTNNFLISKPLFNKVRFDESITNYGHEDTLFGYELKKRNIIIEHIDNPLIHIGLETNEEFIRKTREGIENLKKIMTLNHGEKVFIKDITLLNYFKFLQKTGLSRILKFLFGKSEKRLYNYLVNNKPELLFFDLYKLGYLCSIN